MKYRRPFGTEFEDLDLDTAMDMIADRVLAARYGVFEAALASARDPKSTIVPQRARR